VKEYEYHYIWKEESGKSYMLIKGSSGALSESANKAFYLKHVNAVYENFGDFSLYKPNSMSEFFDSDKLN